MARLEVVTAVTKRLQDSFADCPVYSSNIETDVPSDAGMFVVVQYPVANVEQMDLQAKTYREEGTVRFVVNAQRGFGVEAGIGLADKLASIFRGKKFDGVQTFSSTSPVINDQNDDGLYYTLSVSVPYHFLFKVVTGFYD
jgi:hypothetical protein